MSRHSLRPGGERRGSKRFLAKQRCRGNCLTSIKAPFARDQDTGDSPSQHEERENEYTEQNDKTGERYREPQNVPLHVVPPSRYLCAGRIVCRRRRSQWEPVRRLRFIFRNFVAISNSGNNIANLRRSTFTGDGPKLRSANGERSAAFFEGRWRTIAMGNYFLAGIARAALAAGAAPTVCPVRADDYCAKVSAASVTAPYAPCQPFQTAADSAIPRDEAMQMGLLRLTIGSHLPRANSRRRQRQNNL